MNRMLFSIMIGAIFAACGLAATPSPTMTPFTGTPHPLIIDTDMSTDDWMAILYLLNRPDVQIKAITASGTGIAHARPGAENATRLTTLGQQPNIPIAYGRETPLATTNAFPDEWRANVDNFNGLKLPANPKAISSQSAVELLTATIESSPTKITILALGPLTNLAEALQAKPTLKDQIDSIFIMGGAIEVQGNIASSDVPIANRTAEWNIYCDPLSVNLVFSYGIPIVLVPLDATNHVPVTQDFYKRLEQQRTTPIAEAIFQMLGVNREFMEGGGFYFWDPLAAMAITDPSVLTFATKTLKVIEEVGPNEGQTAVASDGFAVQVAMSADAVRFEQIFLNTLNAPLP